jgi:hypothetical protein
MAMDTCLSDGWESLFRERRAPLGDYLRQLKLLPSLWWLRLELANCLRRSTAGDRKIGAPSRSLHLDLLRSMEAGGGQEAEICAGADQVFTDRGSRAMFEQAVNDLAAGAAEQQIRLLPRCQGMATTTRGVDDARKRGDSDG